MNRNTVADPVIERLVGKMRKVLEDVAENWGAFAVFGLLESEDTPGRWDVIVSAPGLPQGREGIFVIADTILKHLTTPEAILLGSIIPMPSDSDFVRDMKRVAPDVHEEAVAVGPFALGGRSVERGYILASGGKPPRSEAVGAA